MRFTVGCEGLTPKEGQQVIEWLLPIRELDDLNLRFSINASAAGQITMHIPHFEIWATVAAGAVGVIGKAGEKVIDIALKEIGEQIVTRLNDWLKSKASGKSDVEMAVTLYGPDGKLIERVSGKR